MTTIGFDDLPKVAIQPGTVAMFLHTPAREPWEGELQQAVEQGAFHVPRVDLPGLSLDGMATWLDRNLPTSAVSRDTRDRLLSDILALTYTVEDLTSAQHYRLRIFTAPPDRRCGYHVDTVPAAAPLWGCLKVYNGAGTNWFAGDDIRSMAAFYRWLQTRDRIVRTLANDPPHRDAALQVLDEKPDFLVPGARSRRVASRTPVFFKHLPVDRFWTDHETDRAWVHASPMEGARRLVVNISPEQRLPVQ
ncbi:DUF1826 domain-containing protein [Nitrococcus mobilis]|uniref:Uncharacterized protein n=1 Tax=Nitrococcus mobilis Nb-231 TaxID=314278 RepID=A4BRM2_9GAMM|nr:DUF1826 domain-containing protein [Nitrococcus mobilis]EAR21593.1 hypothetical protein NB231_02463 [Nitrococcus mobilis Nb-231]